MYLISLGFSDENRSSDCSIRLTLMFYGENQSQDCCIRPTLDSLSIIDPMLRSLYPTDLSVFSTRTHQMVVQVFDEFSPWVEVLFNYLVFVLCTPSYSSLRGSVRVCFSSCFFICLYLPSWIHMMYMLQLEGEC